MIQYFFILILVKKFDKILFTISCLLFFVYSSLLSSNTTIPISSLPECKIKVKISTKEIKYYNLNKLVLTKTECFALVKNRTSYYRFSYEGEFKNRDFNGFGIMVYPSGDRYTGGWINGSKQGQGTMLYKNGDLYKGAWNTNFKDGYGEMNYANGSYYTGNWSLDQKSGKGQMNYLGGDKYTGLWKNDKKNGYGFYLLLSGDSYFGEFNNNLKSGKGKIAYSNGNTFFGEWKNNKKNGPGILYAKNGYKLIGNWKKNKYAGPNINSKGKVLSFIIISGHGEYTGDIDEEIIIRSGSGIMNYYNGDVYDGNWNNDKFNGTGRMAYSNGDIYEGGWRNGIYFGYGKLNTNISNRYPKQYVGYWKNKIFAGKADIILQNSKDEAYTSTFTGNIITDLDKQIIFKTGLLKDEYDENIYFGDLKNNKKDGFGSIIFKDGSKYIGYWKNDKMNGQGIFVDTKKNIKEGEFIEGEFVN